GPGPPPRRGRSPPRPGSGPPPPARSPAGRIARGLRARRSSLDDWAHLHGAVPRPRQLARELDRGVEVVDLNQEVAAELLLRLRERTIGDELLAVPRADGGGGGAVRELVAAAHHAALDELVRELVVLLVDRVLLIVWDRCPRLLVRVDQQRILHAHPPGPRPAWCRPFTLVDERPKAVPTSFEVLDFDVHALRLAWVARISHPRAEPRGGTSDVPGERLARVRQGTRHPGDGGQRLGRDGDAGPGGGHLPRRP